jgi:5-formyltetrahydrofolate cyclo-ligase
MTKQALRTIYKEKRIQLSDKERAKLDDLLLIQLQTVSIPFIQTLLSYWPIEQFKEPNTHLFTDFIAFRNPELTIAYPAADFTTGQMKAIIVTDETVFEKRETGILEPEDGVELPIDEIDVVLVPLLVTDKKGYRVGYGKGFYDRFLSGCKKDCIKIGFSYFELVNEIANTNEFDVPLNYCITPQVVYVF